MPIVAFVKYTMRRTLAGLVAGICLGLLFVQAFAAGTSPPTDTLAWATPSAMTTKRVSDITGAQHEPGFFQNLNCTLLTYRLVSTNTIRTGCFGETSYGLFDVDSQVVIYNGSDEGVPLYPYATRQTLLPWQKSSELISLDTLNSGGEIISLYRNTLTATRDQRNLIGMLTGKAVSGPPDIGVRDAAGQRLVLNSETIAFSDNGSWLVAETLTGSFVRINLASLTAVPFAPSFGSTGSPALLQSQVAVSNNGHYIAINNKIAGSFKVYDMQKCSANLCQSYDYQPFVKQQIGNYQAIRHVRFVNNGLLSFEVQSTDPSNGGVYEIAPSDSIRSLIDYLGLGDSFTSGEGAFDYRAGTDNATNSCHLSTRSYPLLLTHDLFSATGGHSVACSGATITDVGSKSDSYRGQVDGVKSYGQLETADSALLDSVFTNFLPGYIAQQRFVERYQPRIVSVSVGGNDIGFANILLNCVLPHLSRHVSDQTCYNTYEDRQELLQHIDRTVPRWTALFRQLAATAPGVQLYAIGYPSIASDTGSCSLNTLLAKNELELSEELIRYLNAAIAKSAINAGASYIDISDALSGHRLCETASYNLAVNGLTAGKDTGIFGLNVFGKESYHPNALGQSLIEQAILRKTRNFTLVTKAPVIADTSKILNVPKTGRAVVNKVPQSDLAPQIVKGGKGVSITVKGSAVGLRANTAYDVKFGGLQSIKIGSITTDANGDGQTTVTIPVSTPGGGNTVSVVGENQAGQPVVVTQPVIVPVTDDDVDGDGIVNTVDSCPAVPNSGVDADHDGIDDACDNSVNPVGTGTGSQSAGSGSGGQILAGSAPQIQPSSSLSSTLIVAAQTVSTLPSKTSALQTHVNSAIKGPLPIATETTLAKLANLSLPHAQTATNSSSAKMPSYPELPAVNWRRWLTLLVILWWLLLCIVWALQRLQSADAEHDNEQRFSTNL